MSISNIFIPFFNDKDIAVNFAHVNAPLVSKAYQPINRRCKKESVV
jgi:hypothetical protein